MAVTPPLRTEVVLKPDGTLTQKFAEYLEALEEAVDVSDKIESAISGLIGLGPQIAALDQRLSVLEQDLETGLLARVAQLEKMVSDILQDKFDLEPFARLGQVEKTVLDIQQDQAGLEPFARLGELENRMRDVEVQID